MSTYIQFRLASSGIYSDQAKDLAFSQLMKDISERSGTTRTQSCTIKCNETHIVVRINVF